MVKSPYIGKDKKKKDNPNPPSYINPGPRQYAKSVVDAIPNIAKEDLPKIGDDEHTEVSDSKAQYTDFSTVSDLSNFSKFNFDSTFSSEEVSYVGFSSERFHINMCNYASDAGVSPDEFGKDIADLCVLVVSRGTNHSKLVKKTKPELRDRIETLLNRYDFVAEYDGEAGADLMILSRIPATYPEVCAKLIHKGAMEPNVKTPHELKNFLKFTGGASLIPRTDKKMFGLWLDWAIENDKLINKSDADSDQTVYYGTLSHENGRMTDAERLAFIKSIS
jgi:hypothetical protein